jgi:His-Xaa-Ser system protein HxsD
MSRTEASGASDGCREVRFAAGLYNIDAIKRAAYRISDRARVEIEPSETGVVCRLYPLKAVTEADQLAIENDFSIEVLDQDLRQTIASETEGVRNLILSIAFSKTGAGQ